MTPEQLRAEIARLEAERQRIAAEANAALAYRQGQIDLLKRLLSPDEVAVGIATPPA